VKTRTALSLCLALFLAAAPALAAPIPPVPRPTEWATRVDGTCVNNLYKVDEGLYRAAQPSAKGFQELAALGVKCVLNVSGGPGDDSFIEKGSLKLFHVPMSAFGLRDDRVLEAMKIMADPNNRPLLIHCQQGADRTGAMVALYRVVVQGWTAEKAVEEMTQGGYHHSSLWKSLETYVLKADAAALRKKLGIKGPLTPAESAKAVAAGVPAAAASTAPAPQAP
jgi:protein tyrosine phosphatase (PTP) superfamily phosphohydrolase (DUF442 family)